MRRWMVMVAAVLPAMLGSCTTAPEPRAPRTIVEAWREAGRTLPAGAARDTYLRLAEEAVKASEGVRAAEIAALRGLLKSDRHDASRADLYKPFGALALRRQAALQEYASTRVAMRGALSAEEWVTVVKAVRR